ncbi:MAG: tryptophan-rich sensory protein [Methylobacteriaceae bacterium]|nr:tryptophan-rich sensory protein [Methylobacteriaceae bacterium]
MSDAALARPASGSLAFHALAAIVPVALASALGSLATLPNIPTWYAGLVKPPLTPPNAVFGPTWTILFVLMAYAAFRVWRLPAGTSGRGRALALFYGQLTLNALWSWAFFGGRSPGLGLIVIAGMLVAITLTIRAFAPLDRIAAWLLAPYLAWVSFASYLNLGIWWLNR